ncbi:MAG TPA: FUSC family protein [Candidatus Dormibacteraeota bacterium]|nr:FUSC family protein [Candidatus Dormibacteraeota bacterium]
MTRTRTRRLELAAPRWIVEVVRPRPAPVPWADVIRCAIAIPMPLLVGVLTGNLDVAIFVTLGAIAGATSDRGGPLRTRALRVSLPPVAAAAGLLIGHAVIGTGWIAVAAVALLSLVSAQISVLGAAASVAALQLLVYAAVASALKFPQPVYLPSLLVLAGGAWALLLTLVQALIEGPTRPERIAVAAVFVALARLVAATGTREAAAARQDLTQALNIAYDHLLGDRVIATGRWRQLVRLAGLLNSTTPLVEATVALSQTERHPPPGLSEALIGVAEAVARHRPPPPMPAELVPDRPSLRAVCRGLEAVVRQIDQPASDPMPGRRVPLWPRLRTWIGEALLGRSTWLYALRLALCMAAAEAVEQRLPLERPYWIVLTVAIVLKPDFGSVFARAVQRGLGTLIGVLIGAAVVAVVPPGPLYLPVMAVFAGILPISVRRNYGMFSTFLTPLVIMLIDFGASGGPALVVARLLDTLIGCGLVLVIGYLLWPGTWRVRLGDQVADAIDVVAGYAGTAFGADRSRGRSRRHAYRTLSDVRTSLQQRLAEPPPASSRAAAWWPVIVELELTTDAITAAAIRAVHGGSGPAEKTPAALEKALRELSAALRESRVPPEPGLPDDEAVTAVTDRIRSIRSVMAGPAERRARSGPRRPRPTAA